MNITFGKHKFRLQKKVMAFFGIIPLLIATALIPVPCPVCGGTGQVSSTNMDGVSILGDTTATVVQSWLVTCNTYRKYQMDVTMQLQNTSTEPANGIVSLILTDVASGRELSGINVVINVGPETVTTLTVPAVFGIAVVDDPQQTVHVVAKVRYTNSPCEACGGSGRVALNAWPTYNSIKDNYKQTLVLEQQYNPLVRVDTEMGTD